MQAWATTVRVAACGLVSLVLLGAVMTTPAMSDESVGAESELQAFYRDFLEVSFAMRPLSATFLGDHRFDDQLDDISAAARARWLAHDRDTLAALEQRFGEAAAAGRLSLSIDKIVALSLSLVPPSLGRFFGSSKAPFFFYLPSFLLLLLLLLISVQDR